MSHNTFKNAKPTLLGEDTHEAEVSGTGVADIVKSISWPVSTQAISCTTQAPTWTTQSTITVTVSDPVNELFLRAQAGYRVSSGNNIEVRMLRDGDTGDILATAGGGPQSGVWSMETTINDETVGVHNYQIQIQISSGQSETCCLENVFNHYILAESDESDITPSLIGENTQSAPPARSVFT